MLRAKMKVYTDETGARFLVALGLVHPHHIQAFIMSDEKTVGKMFSHAEWNALPFFYFKEDGEAPRHKSWVPGVGPAGEP